jgi:hypothetical protein
MLISIALLLDSIIRNSVCTPAKLPCRRVVKGKDIFLNMYTYTDVPKFAEQLNGTLLSNH